MQEFEASATHSGLVRLGGARQTLVPRSCFSCDRRCLWSKAGAKPSAARCDSEAGAGGAGDLGAASPSANGPTRGKLSAGRRRAEPRQPVRVASTSAKKIRPKGRGTGTLPVCFSRRHVASRRRSRRCRCCLLLGALQPMRRCRPQRSGVSSGCRSILLPLYSPPSKAGPRKRWLLRLISSVSLRKAQLDCWTCSHAVMLSAPFLRGSSATHTSVFEVFNPLVAMGLKRLMKRSTHCPPHTMKHNQHTHDKKQQQSNFSLFLNY
jgi:hypothetical protein